MKMQLAITKVIKLNPKFTEAKQYWYNSINTW